MKGIVQKIPFFRITAAFSAGILTGSIVQVNLPVLGGILVIFLFLLLLLNSCYTLKRSVYFGFIAHLFFIGAGMWAYLQYNQKPEFFSSGIFVGSVLEIPQEKAHSYHAIGKIHARFEKKSLVQTEERVMMIFEKDKSSERIIPGQMVVFSQNPQMIRNSNNPFEFDYSKYLSRKKIYRQVYLSSGMWIPYHQAAPFNLSTFAEKVRMQFLEIYDRQNWNKQQFSILSALTLGYRRGLDPQIKQTFASAGALHVLAVSGLHTGILFFILSFFLGFLKKYRAGRFLFVLLVVMFLWSFAFITGLSPSVKRAALMFSFVVVGQNLRKPLNIYNTLLASAFFLLLFNPNNLFEAGFQLSYAAVFGIVFLHPRIDKLFPCRNKLLRYLWGLFSVSVAAQVATFPISLFYFHQFPIYFWASSMVVIPVVTLLIPLGIIILAFHQFTILSWLVSGSIGELITLIIRFLEGIEKLPYAVLPASVNFLELLLVLAIMVSLFFFIEFKNRFYFKSSLYFILAYFLVALGIQTVGLFRKEVIVYNYEGQHVLHLISGKRNYIVSENELQESEWVHNLINNTVQGLRMQSPIYLTCADFYNDSILYLNNRHVCFNDQVIYFLSGRPQEKYIFVPDVIVKNSFQERYGGLLFFTRLIGSGVNRDNLQTVNIYSLTEKGAFRKKW